MLSPALLCSKAGQKVSYHIIKIIIIIIFIIIITIIIIIIIIIICPALLCSKAGQILTSHYQDWTFFAIYLFFHFTKYFSGLNAPWKRTTTSITGKFPVTFYFSLSLPLVCRDDFFEFIPGKKKRYISLTIYQSMGAL